MNSFHCLAKVRSSRFRFLLSRLLLVLTGATGFLAGEVMAADESAPPLFPDAVHVREGCYISAFAYLARFRAAFPNENGRTLRVNIPGFAGSHTVALVSWQSGWWVRDEYCGVIALDRDTANLAADAEPLRVRAEALLRDIARRLLREGRLTVPSEPEPSLAERMRDVSHAASLLPVKSSTYWVTCDGRELPFLFFLPEPGMMAVYDPASGTARAKSVPAAEADLVRVVAHRLGYTVTAVRAETADGGMVVAGISPR